MANEASETRLMGFLVGAEKIISAMKGKVIDTAGRQSRNYTDEEELYLKRLEDALEYIGKARFCVIQSGFRCEHESKRMANLGTGRRI